ncbi:MAG: SusC/RagA family TonB-linked outer membrane protein [Acidobacterium ailaaui]|nr:SusC/RagA family TonB-linked outer membrane protein [Pseudacidobacterium ailaaui]
MFRNGLNQNYQISGSGGTKNVQYYIGAGFQNNEGDIITNYQQKYSINSRIDAQMNKWLKVGMYFNGSYSHKRLPSIGFQDAIRTANWLPITLYDTTLVNYAKAAGYDVNLGDYAAERYFTNVNGANLEISSNNNSLAKMLGRFSIYNTYRTFFDLHAAAEILPGMQFKTSFGGYFKQYAYNYFQTSWSYQTGETEGIYNAYHLLNWYNENTLTYHRHFGKHDVPFLAGLSEQANSQKFVNMTVSNFASDLIQTLNGGSLINDANTSITQSTLASTFFRINYDFANKYIAALSTRWDGSSRFGANNKWGNFPSASAAWIISNEHFLSDSRWISMLKLRASYGTTGNDNIGDYSALAIVNPGYNYVLGSGVVSGFATSSLANPNLQWEKTGAFDVGIDFDAFRDRISLSADYYNKKTIHMLLQQQIPAVTGFNSVWTNAGKIRNTGFELEVASHNIVGKNFHWNTTANFYTNKNTVLDLAGSQSLITTPDPKRPSQFIAQVGYPLVEFYGYVVDPSKGDHGLVPRDQMKNPFWPINVASTFVYVKDINHDGQITDADRVPLGTPYPKFNLSITNEFSYKNFTLSFMIQGSEGGKIFNIDEYYWSSFGNGIYGSNAKDINYLQPTYLTNYDVQNASFVALRNLSLGYELPERVLRRMHFSGFRVYFNAYNLIYIMGKGYTGQDPETVNMFQPNPLVWGYQRGPWPVLRSYTLGVDVNI